MLLLKLKHLRVERWILEDACREICEYAQNAGLEIDPAADDAACEVVRELIVFATYASTIPPSPHALFERFVLGFPFSALLDIHKRDFVLAALDFFRDNHWRYRADCPQMPIVGNDELSSRYDRLFKYIDDFNVFVGPALIDKTKTKDE